MQFVWKVYSIEKFRIGLASNESYQTKETTIHEICFKDTALKVKMYLMSRWIFFKKSKNDIFEKKPSHDFVYYNHSFFV